MDISEALNLNGLKYFYTKYVKPLRTRVNQLGTASNCTVVNNATTTVTNTVLDGRMGKTLGDRIANVENKTKVIGAEAFSGYYASNWNLTTNYQDIGNTKTITNSYYTVSGNTSAITVLTKGLYLVQARMLLNCTGESKVWMKIMVNGSTRHLAILPVSSDNTIETLYITTLFPNDKIACQVSKLGDSVTVTATKNQSWLDIIKLT